VLRGENRKVVLGNFSKDERYGILDVKVTEGNTVGSEVSQWYAVVNLTDATPLVPAWQLDARAWVVPLNGDIWSAGVLRLPFRRLSGQASSAPGIFGLVELFYPIPGLFCREIPVESPKVRRELVGCIESIDAGEVKDQEWFGIIQLTRVRERIIERVVPVGSAYRLHLFDLKAGRAAWPQDLATIWTFRGKYVIPRDRAFIVVPKGIVVPLKLAQESIQVSAEGAESLIVCPAPCAFPGLQGAVSVRVYPGVQGSVHILAAGVDKRAAFRYFEEEVGRGDLYSYGVLQAGMIELPKGLEQFYPGFLRQLFWTGGKHLVYKTWDGLPNKRSLGAVSSAKILSRVLVRPQKKSDPCTVELSASLTVRGVDMPVPMNIHKYVSDPAGFLGLVQVEKSLKGDVVNFTDTGLIVLKITGKTLAQVQQDQAALKKLVSLDENWRGTVEWKALESGESDMEENLPVGESASGIDDDTLLMVEVAVAAFVAALVISLIGFWIYKRRSKAQANRSSSVSHSSSSEEVRQEGLMETCE
jgi:hypothetical protein